MHNSARLRITHEHYFQTYNLSVEQYGEILVTLAYSGEKMPDNRKGYDVEAKIDSKPARIEVKSKLANGPTGPASVIHCNDNKFGPDGMTHLVVILVSREKNEPSVKEAWILSQNAAKKLRRERTKSKYINVHDLRKEPKKTLNPIKSITTKLQEAAQSFA